MTLMRTLGSDNLKLPDSVFQRLDSLLTQAESAQKDADRAEVLALAEQYVVDEAIVVPIVESAVCYAAPSSHGQCHVQLFLPCAGSCCNG